MSGIKEKLNGIVEEVKKLPLNYWKYFHVGFMFFLFSTVFRGFSVWAYRVEGKTVEDYIEAHPDAEATYVFVEYTGIGLMLVVALLAALRIIFKNRSKLSK